jgi:hypothetical protein
MSGFQVSTESTLEEASERFATVDARVRQTLANKGFAGTAVPPICLNAQGQQQVYNGWIPPDLTKLKDDELGGFLGLLSGWLDYVQQQLADAHGSMTIANAKLEFVNAHLLMIHKREGDKKRPEPERKAMVLIDKRYIEAQTESIYNETYYRHVKAIATAAEQNYSAVSRRISQRQQDVERQRRTTGALNAPVGPFFQRT